jgi:hypothetical protein
MLGERGSADSSLKQFLNIAPVLALPSPEKPFHLFVNVDKGTALGVLTQECGRKKQPVAYLSKFLEPIIQRWPECTQAVAAMALLTEES